ncbi:hypothetical protein DJ75_12315 [Halorubrum sp. Eb13]|nr:hypothetical protein DJ75_12315 [Halorubrum sp. Eb13]
MSSNRTDNGLVTDGLVTDGLVTDGLAISRTAVERSRAPPPCRPSRRTPRPTSRS